jgi:hypothetical protein
MFSAHFFCTFFCSFFAQIKLIFGNVWAISGARSSPFTAPSGVQVSQLSLEEKIALMCADPKHTGVDACNMMSAGCLRLGIPSYMHLVRFGSRSTHFLVTLCSGFARFLLTFDPFSGGRSRRTPP